MPQCNFQSFMILSLFIIVDAPAHSSTTLLTSDPNITITGLVPHQLYMFTVAAETNGGVGPKVSITGLTGEITCLVSSYFLTHLTNPLAYNQHLLNAK